MRIINQSGQDFEVTLNFDSNTEKPHHYLMEGQSVKDVPDDCCVFEIHTPVDRANWDKRKKKFPDIFEEVN